MIDRRPWPGTRGPGPASGTWTRRRPAGVWTVGSPRVRP